MHEGKRYKEVIKVMFSVGSLNTSSTFNYLSYFTQNVPNSKADED